jgi:hypothetical protein
VLFPLLIDVLHDLVGLAPASLFEQVTGVGRMTFQRGRGYATLLGPRRYEIEQHRDAWLLASMRSRGLTEQEAAEALASIPQGLAAQAIHGLGLLDPNSSEMIRSLATRFDAADLWLCKLADADDLHGLAHELGPRSPLGRAYCAPLDVSGLDSLPPGVDASEAALVRLLLTRRAHMALSLLAAVDHEMSRWNARIVGWDAWAGKSRFAMLLSEPAPGAGRRVRPADPFARLVDFIGAVGHRVRRGCWPDAVPTIIEMGCQAELVDVVAGDGARFIRKLRTGTPPITQAAFRRFVRSQIAEDRHTPRGETQLHGDLLAPYLFAAHLFTRLMPALDGKPAYRDRTGWRQAYLAWWQRHAEACPPSAAPAADRPPAWLLAP